MSDILLTDVLLTARALSKEYGSEVVVRAVRDVSLAIEPGQIVTVIGPNGAGKTTLLGAAIGLLPWRGRIRYAGHFADTSAELWQLAVQLELEGIIAKDAESRYKAGRTNRWLKIKTTSGEERERARWPG